MTEWIYLQDVKKEEHEAFCEKHMKEHPDHVCRFATARSNNPGMKAIYYMSKSKT